MSSQSWPALSVQRNRGFIGIRIQREELLVGHVRIAAPDDSDAHRRVSRHEKKSVKINRLLADETYFPIVII